MKPGKAPGPDGFTLPYYRLLSSELRCLTAAFNSIADGSHFTKDLLGTHITVIRKEGKGHSMCAHYRPIILLNIDLKILTKIMVNRLATFLPDLISLDQVGFVPGREARDDVIKVLYLLHLSSTAATPCLFLSTDAEKAFDCVNWTFLHSTLPHIDVGPGFQRFFKALYADPSAKVKVNGTHSEPFTILKGTRQGCPFPRFSLFWLYPLYGR